MIYRLIFLCLLCLSINVDAQNYYVTAFKGRVSYKGKVLQKKDKIRVKGRLVFSTMNDWVKVVGPGGIYKLEPESKGSTGSEFFTALREELFPRVRERGSFAYDAESNTSQPNCLEIHWMLTYFSGHQFSLPGPVTGHEENLRYIFLVDDGVAVRPALLEEGRIILDKKTWADIDNLVEPQPFLEDESLLNEYAAVVVINDAAAFQAAVDQATNFADMGLDLISCSELIMDWKVYPEGSDQYAKDSAKVADYAYPDTNQPDATATVLSFFNPQQFIDGKLFDEELRFMIKKAQPEDAEDFLTNMQYENYLKEEYGLLVLPNGLSSYVRAIIGK